MAPQSRASAVAMHAFHFFLGFFLFRVMRHDIEYTGIDIELHPFELLIGQNRSALQGVAQQIAVDPQGIATVVWVIGARGGGIVQAATSVRG